MAQLYANENFPLPVVQELRRLGHNVQTTDDAGKSDQAIVDEEVLAHAMKEGRAVLTLNRRHFIRLHKQHPNHSGVIACTVDSDFIGLAKRIHVATQEAGDLAGSLLRINRPNPS